MNLEDERQNVIRLKKEISNGEERIGLLMREKELDQQEIRRQIT